MYKAFMFEPAPYSKEEAAFNQMNLMTNHEGCSSKDPTLVIQEAQAATKRCGFGFLWLNLSILSNHRIVTYCHVKLPQGGRVYSYTPKGPPPSCTTKPGARPAILEEI